MAERLPSNDGPDRNRSGDGVRLGGTLALILILAGFWILLSGRFGIQYFIFMAATLALVLWLNPQRPFSRSDPSRGAGASGLTQGAVHLVRYLVWLVWNVMTANIDVARRILSPSLPIRPQLMVFRTELEGEVARVLVANSMTLTPGTVTINLEEDRYLVHALHPDTAGVVTSGALQNVVGRIFGEGPEPPPRIWWIHSLDELKEPLGKPAFRRDLV